MPGATALTDAVARSLFKLMAYKDEYEVARLYTDGRFARQVAATFEGENLRYEFHLAPPLLARSDPATGVPRKMSFGPWMMTRLPRARALQGPARHAVRPVRLHARAQDGAPADRRLRGCWSRRSSAGSTPAITRSPSASPTSRRRSAASATSRSATSRPRRRRRRRCWRSSGRRSAPLPVAAE